MITADEWSNQFDVLYNNITSNQAPGLTEYEKSVFLTKAQDEIVKNYFTANSKGNNIQQGFDDSAKRQADFSNLLKVFESEEITDSNSKIDPRSITFKFPSDVFISINESIMVDGNLGKIRQVIPLKYSDYVRLMSKPYKRPLKNQAWRLVVSHSITRNSENSSVDTNRIVEVITAPGETTNITYTIRYIRKPIPIILTDLSEEDLSIDGYNTIQNPVCELDPCVHQDILQRAVELGKIAWTSTGNDNAQTIVQAGLRSE